MTRRSLKRAGRLSPLRVLLALTIAGACMPAAASASPGALDILIAYADTGSPTTLQSEIQAVPGVHSVSLFNANTGTPTAAQLAANDLVITFSDNAFADSATLGNRLADYVDGGGRVALPQFANYGNDCCRPTGRFFSGGYSAFAPSGTGFDSSASNLGTRDAASPLMQGVTALRGTYRGPYTLNSGATEVARWADGVLAVASKGRVVNVNAYLGPNAGSHSGDFGRLFANAAGLVGASGPTTCSVTAVRRGAQDQADVTVIAAGGLKLINHVVTDNASVTVPTFTVGTTGPVIVTATKSVQGTLSRFSFNAVNLADQVKFCA